MVKWIRKKLWERKTGRLLMGVARKIHKETGDSYPDIMISTGYSSRYELKMAKVEYKEANEFCPKKGLEVKTMHVTTTPARPAQLGSTELQFKCVAPDGTAQPLVKEANTVIEIRNR